MASLPTKRSWIRWPAWSSAWLWPTGAWPPSGILDVTCGTGSVVRRLAARGHLVVGVDPVAPLVEQARRASRHFTTCSFHAVDVARQDPPAPGSFDAVVSMHTLYWHPEPDRVLDACRRALRPGGHAIVLTYSRPAAVFPVARAVWRAEGVRAALQSLRWLLPTAAFELARGGAHRYLAPGELAELLLEHGLVPLGILSRLPRRHQPAHMEPPQRRGTRPSGRRDIRETLGIGGPTSASWAPLEETR